MYKQMPTQQDKIITVKFGIKFGRKNGNLRKQGSSEMNKECRWLSLLHDALSARLVQMRDGLCIRRYWFWKVAKKTPRAGTRQLPRCPIPTSTLLRILNSVLPLRDSTFSLKKYDLFREAFALFTVFGRCALTLPPPASLIGKQLCSIFFEFT